MSLIDYFATHIVPRMYRGKGALHPCETGRLTDVVSCVREYDVNIFLLRKGKATIAIDAGYKGHPGLVPGCEAVGIKPESVEALFLTHADPDHAGGLDVRQENRFSHAQVYLGEIEENYLTNTYHRKQIGPFGLKNSVTIADGYRLLADGEEVQVGEFTVQALLVPGHTLGHLCYLVDGTMLFTGDAIALNKDGGWCFFDMFNYDSDLNRRSLEALRRRIDLNRVEYVFTSHNGFTDDAKKAFSHIDVLPDLNAKGFLFDETAPYDCFAE
ncbi:MBL fold metallo-hydrolase [Slackia heliotrinireducens]|uniref:MBL fold metallo-hydrolase n=1 Tax=Slackia heliotrinireducens TaxID=84110 RepID=UPI003314BC5E